MASSAKMPASAHMYNTYHQKLQNDWKLKAYCGREYYRTDEIVKWMRRTDTDELANNAGLLITEVYKGYLHHPTSAEISHEDYRCLIVFAILLELGYGRLVHVFQRHHITDKRLPELPNIESLREDLKRMGIRDIEGFWEQFQQKMWLYYPCRLEFGMRSTFLDYGRGRWIMPFCRRQPINLKGGTAQVWEVVVQESHVPPTLAKAASKSKYEDNEYGTCYTFAVKMYREWHIDIFEWEKDAYLAMKNKRGMVQFLGEYEIHERLEDGKIAHTRNILLEYGDYDLEEFFSLPRNYPPVLNGEAIHFWKSMANVAEALDSMHDLEVERENGHRDTFLGWHCDLKPDNILRVDGKFKLADFGFAKFKQKYSHPGKVPPREEITGGTETYGAPECDVARRDSSKTVSQAIDTWSFGCVLSVSATWVVLGYQGVLDYHELRRLAIQKLRTRRSMGENVTVPVANDAFHNGVDVLPEVKEWHVHLRSLLRLSDTITGRILDLVDEKMLLAESPRQFNCEALHISIKEKVQQAEAHYEQLVEKGVVRRVSTSVSEALLGNEKRKPSAARSQVSGRAQIDPKESSYGSSHSLLVPPECQRHEVKSSRIKKSKMGEAVQGSVAHRQDALGTHREHFDKRMSVDDYICRPAQHPIPPARPSAQTKAPKISIRTGTILEGAPTLTNKNSPYSPSDLTHHGYGNPIIESPRNDELNSSSHSPIWGDGYALPRMESLDHGSQAPIPISPEASRPLSLSPKHYHINPLWPIHQEYQAKKSRERGVRARLFPKKADGYLKQFLMDRDIMFLVDNDTSMNPYWDAMAEVLETLVSKVDRLDKDGLDLEFTNGNEFNAYGVSGNRLLSKFKAANQDALLRQYNIETNMATSLTRIFDRYLHGAKRATTLLVLTDGVWEGTVDVSSVELAIANFLKKPFFEERMERRWFTIQFISLGQDVPDILKRLDDEMETKYSVPDVIDTEHVSGDVNKMILGSFVDKFDEKAPSPLSPISPSTPSHFDPYSESSSVPSHIMRQNSSRFSIRNMLRG